MLQHALILKRSAHWQHFFSTYKRGIKIHEEYPLCHSGDLYCGMVAWSVCMERNRADPCPPCTCRYCIVIRDYQKSIGIFYSVFLIYTVHSISKATVLNCSHFVITD